MTEASQIQAALKPSPTLTLQVENAFGNGDFNALSQSESSLTLGQTIELGDKRQHRINYALANTDKIQAEYELERLTVLAETSRRFYAVLRIQAMAQVYEDRLVQEQKALSIIKKRAQAGAVGQADVSKMALRVARSKAQTQRLSVEFDLAKTRLAVMWLAEANFEQADGDIKQLPPLPDLAHLNVAIDKTPALLVQKSQQELMQQQLLLAQANGRQDVNFGIGLRHFAETDDQALMFNLSVPLSLENPNKGNISAANIAFERSIQQTELKRTELKLALTEIQQRLEATNDYTNTLSEQLLPQAEQLLSDTIRGYQHGRYSVLEWVDAQNERFELESELIDNAHRMYMDLLDLERLTGQALTTDIDNNLGNLRHE